MQSNVYYPYPPYGRRFDITSHKGRHYYRQHFRQAHIVILKSKFQLVACVRKGEGG